MYWLKSTHIECSFRRVVVGLLARLVLVLRLIGLVLSRRTLMVVPLTLQLGTLATMQMALLHLAVETGIMCLAAAERLPVVTPAGANVAARKFTCLRTT